jgi:hypothetical protein
MEPTERLSDKMLRQILGMALSPVCSDRNIVVCMVQEIMDYRNAAQHSALQPGQVAVDEVELRRCIGEVRVSKAGTESRQRQWLARFGLAEKPTPAPEGE